MTKQTILYIDDEEDNLSVFKSSFRHDYNVITAENARKGMYFLRETSVDLIISDLKMPEQSGIDFLTEMAKEFPDISRIMLTAYSETDTILKSINAAQVFGYITKPWKKDEIKRLIDSALQSTILKKQNRELINHLTISNEKLQKANSEIEHLKSMLEVENKYLRKAVEEERGGDVMIGESPSLNEIKFKIEQVAHLNTTVLIQGETGTGKELVARAIHRMSARSSKPFVKLNCASLPSSLVESELFGFEKGSFTGANQNKPGLFEIADEGTIFLDEIGELSLEVQPKLLRVLQEGEFYKIGSSKPIRVNVRVVAATNRVLQKEVEKGTFRGDLFYRLNIFPINVPPLRERKADLPKLVDHLVQKYQRRLGIAIKEIPKGTIDLLMKHQWPGNIRELEAVIERSMIISGSGKLDVDIFHTSEVEVPGSDNTVLSLQEMERQYITSVLKKVKWKIAGKNGAADLLKINHNTLRSKMIKLGVEFKSD